ncbi:hypothetical protein F511_17291 [Dorcoceras hygrometricum]|uniref:Uncharacterized protein n=1 Tax=Dorcoceras hygrometricum TaxID=472368 RepID=A0A2Z7BDB5_9LAMI|nr:hypothetical protein F511_17291 [Dorcoceras hygrometricum]
MFSLDHNSNPNFDEQNWINQIRRALDEDDDLEEESELPVSIFNVPKALMIDGKEQDLRCKKIEKAATSSQIPASSLPFDQVRAHVSGLLPELPELQWGNSSMDDVVDSCFLLEFLQVFAVEEGRILTRDSSRVSHFVASLRRKSTSRDNAFVRDMIMIENQIPLFCVRKVLEFQLGGLKTEADNMLYAMIIGFCKELSPFKMIQELPDVHQVMCCDHLLDLFYHLIVPEFGETSSEITLEIEEQQTEEVDKRNLWKLSMSKLKTVPMRLIKRILVSKPARLVFKFPWKIISNLPGVIVLRQLEYVCFSQDRERNSAGNRNNMNMPPLMEEIAIPSVTELSGAGVKFSATDEGISSIRFDVKSATLHLPTIILDMNTEAAIRNLIAYESCTTSGPLVLTRYAELINGIIDTEEDAKFLREKGIILNHLKSDGDVANLWNGMTKSVQLTKVPFLDKVIEDLNVCYNQSFKVKIGKFMAQNVYGSWQSLSLMAAIMVLFLMSFQTFCSAFSCNHLFRR